MKLWNRGRFCHRDSIQQEHTVSSSSPECFLASSVCCITFLQDRFSRQCSTGANCICPEPFKEKQHFQILGNGSRHGAIHYKAAICTAALGHINQVCHKLYTFQGCAAVCRMLWWAIDSSLASFSSRFPMCEDKNGKKLYMPDRGPES